MSNALTVNRRKAPRFGLNVSFGDGPDVNSLRRFGEADPQLFIAKIQGLIDSGNLRWGDVRNLRHLMDSLDHIRVPVYDPMAPSHDGARAVMASAFQVTASGLTIAGLNDAYDSVLTIGQDLVTEMNSKQRTTTIAGITSQNPSVDGVREGDPFPEIQAGDEKFQIGHKRDGRMLSITAETIEENDVAGIEQRIDALGEIAGETIEEQTIRRVFDIDGSAAAASQPYVMNLGGLGLSLYRTNNTGLPRMPSSGSRLTTNPLNDTTSLDAAREQLAAMTNTRGKRINMPVSEMVLVVPDSLAGVALKLLNSELEPGVRNEINNWGPLGRWRPKFVSSPKIDDLSTTAWYLGIPKKQFTRKWKLNLETVTLTGDNQRFLERRIAYQARIAWDVEIGVRDYVYMVQSLSGTTAPTP